MMLDHLLQDVRMQKGSHVLVLRRTAGIGKTALLEYFVERSHEVRVARAVGVQTEMELAFAGLQQICGPLLDGLDRLPVPQREAISVAFGLTAGHTPDHFLVALGVLGLLSNAAANQPVVAVVDDAQWLDTASTQILGFVARRLQTESLALVFAVRSGAEREEFAGLPDFVVEGLDRVAARDLLLSAIPGRLDEQVVDRIVAETQGNPRALLAFPHGLLSDELAGGFGVPVAPSMTRIEASSLSRLRLLPYETKRLLLLAAAEPIGDPTLLWSAADQFGLGIQAAAPAEAVGLVKLNGKVQFCHPELRSVVYSAATAEDRQAAHRALAAAIDAQLDPDRRAWHRARAALAPDEEVAAELERTADRALARGGLAAAAAFLERSATLTPASRTGTAYDLFSAMGAQVFARRASRELLAAGERSRRHALGKSSALTPQEQHVVQLARAGRSNQEIGSELFISTKTVEYHLHKAFTKLGINSRHELAHVLAPTDGRASGGHDGFAHGSRSAHAA
jgi:DNA-binding CsgD family transcriptional regulator